jgi:glycosyltransferase involved in cell wall biosynthesis
MKIIHVSDGYRRINSRAGSSIERVIFEVSKALVNLGCEVTVLERKLPGMKDFEELEGLQIIRLDKRRADVSDLFSLNSPIGLLRIILDGFVFALSSKRCFEQVNKDFDVVNFHLPLSGLLSVFLNRKMRKRMVYTYHGNEWRLGFGDRERLPILLRLFQPDLVLMKRVGKIVVLNDSLREKLASIYGINPRNIKVIHNAVDNEAFNSNTDVDSAKRSCGLSGKIVVLFVGLLMPGKGVEYLVKAANILINHGRYKNIFFLVVGSKGWVKNYAEYVQRLVRAYGLANYFRFTDHVDYATLGRIYSACDIFVLPSLDEGFGLVIGEAMSFGKPVIGTRVGGIPMQIIHGWNGFLVDPANEKQLAERISYLVDNRPERERMGKNGRRFVEEKFNWRRVAQEYENLYQSILRPETESYDAPIS